MKKIFRWLSSNDSIYNAALSFVAYRIEHHGELLTPDHLSSMGWIKEGNCWVEKNIKKNLCLGNWPWICFMKQK